MLKQKWKYYLAGILFNLLVMSTIFLLVTSIVPFFYSGNNPSLDSGNIRVNESVSLPSWTVSVSSIDYYLSSQVNAGYRIPGTPTIEKVRQFIKQEVAPFPVFFQNFTYMGVNISNVIVRIDPPNTTGYQIILGAHYDTRAQATSEPSTQPVPGANDGASGVAGLLSIIEWLETEDRWKGMNVSLVFIFFDAEDQGNLNGWDWIVGSSYYASHMNQSEVDRTLSFVLLDMIGDPYLNLKRELFSTQALNQEIWSIARALGFGAYFSNNTGYWLIDDHRPFLDRGIPSIDLIDFDYSEWHKTTDDLDHVSSVSVAIVSDVVLYWLSQKASFNSKLQTSASTSSQTTSPSVSTNSTSPSQTTTVSSRTVTNDFSFSFVAGLIVVSSIHVRCFVNKRKK